MTGAGSATPRLTPWFGAVGVLLLATLLAAGFVQVRQFALLNASMQYQDDYLVLSLYQLETEYLRLRERLHAEASHTDAAPAAAPAGDDPLQLRYDIFVSRIELLEGDRARRLLAGTPVADEVLPALNAFTRHADLYLGTGSAGRVSPQAAQALLTELTGIGEPVHRLMLEASHQVARQVVERQSQVRQHNLVGMALTVFLSCMVLLFALVALRQMRALGERHQRLEGLADALRSARAESEAANAAKSAFLADMSHELRTPLHGLMAMLALLRDSPRHARAAGWLATADDSANHLQRLLDDLLDLSKLESGTLQLAPQSVQPAQLLREASTLMQPAALAKGLRLVSELDPALPDTAWLDPTRVRQVLFNLTANAVKYSEHGAVVLRCAPGRGDDGREHLAFEVADTGIGMDPDTLSRLFHRFTRAEDPRARRQAGAGLGLAISRNLAALMGGEIIVRSTPGAGSVFIFRCPLLPVPSGQAASAAALAAVPAAQPLPQRPLRVLVVDDHPVNRLVLQALLERLGHTWREAINGLEALQALRAEPFDLVMMDVHMPVMDGVAATGALRELPPPIGRTPVIALTADVFAETRNRCLEAGAAEVLTKPLSMATLAAVLQRHFGTSAPAAVPAETAAAGEPAAAAGLLLDPAAVADVRNLMGGERAPAVYAGFFAEATEAAERMRTAMRQADVAALGNAAHAVKGAALNLGLPALAAAAARLSSESGTLTAAPLASAVQQFEDLVTATRRMCVNEGLVNT